MGALKAFWKQVRNAHVSAGLVHLFFTSEDVQSWANTEKSWAARRKPKFHWVVQLQAKETHCQFTQAVHFPDSARLLLHTISLPKTAMHQ